MSPSSPPGHPHLASSPLLRSLAETTSALILVIGDRLLYANPAAAEATGYGADELVGMDLTELVHPDSRSIADELLAVRAGKQGAATRRALQVRRKDGDSRWLYLTATRADLDGHPAIVVSGFDVSRQQQAERELRRSQESLALVQRAARSVYWEWEPDSDRLTVADFADELAGFSVHKIARTGNEFVELIHPEDRQRLRKALLDTLRQGQDLAVELRFITPSGQVRWLAERTVPLRDQRGWTRRVIGVAHDISERKIAEEALFQEKEKADVTLASIADGVIRTDERGKIDYLNPVAQRLTGWSLAEAYGQPAEQVYKVVDQETGNRLLDPLSQCLRERRESIFVGDRLLVDRDGDGHPIHDSAAPIRNRAGEIIGAVLVFRDLSRLRQIELEMLRLASHDPLTGLINRQGFTKLLEQTLAPSDAEPRLHALCHFDLDNFRLVNDTSGQEAGDQLIQQTAQLISAQVRERDLVAHLGGDAFAVLLRGCTLSQAHDLAEEIRHAIRGHRFVWRERIFSTPVSAGLVPIGPRNLEPEALLRDADAACNVAKEKGGDRIHAFQPGDSTIAERYGQMRWISRINQAFDDGRFTLYQQSIVPLQDGERDPQFCELLLRLIDEEGRLVGPANFIPAAERYGMITEIDRWVVRTAFAMLAERARDTAGPATLFTLNLSGSSLGVADFPDMVIAEFERTGVGPTQVLFEITETAAISDLPRAQRFLSALKGMGCRFILDDFGKGLSSLGYLKNLPLDFLKIDGSFVRDMTTDPIQTALVASIHEIGDVMGLRTIAESVEDEETLEAVRRIGIDYAQGFLLSCPQPLQPSRR